MQKSLILLVCSGLCLPSVGAAQSSASEAATISANVIKALSLAKLSAGNLSFGLAARGSTDQINYRSSGAAHFRSTGQVASSIDVSFTTTTLSNGASSLTFTPTVAGNTVDNKNAASVLNSGTDVTLHGTTGEYFLWVGGTLVVSSAATLGAYSGAWTLTLAYTGT